MTGLKTTAKRFTREGGVHAKGIAMKKVFRNRDAGKGDKGGFTRSKAMHVDDYQEADVVRKGEKSSFKQQQQRSLPNPARLPGAGSQRTSPQQQRHVSAAGGAASTTNYSSGTDQRCVC
jgi:hypothetical protein